MDFDNQNLCNCSKCINTTHFQTHPNMIVLVIISIWPLSIPLYSYYIINPTIDNPIHVNLIISHDIPTSKNR